MSSDAGRSLIGMNISLSSATSRDGTKIAYDRLGDGPAVVLVGGATQHRAVDQTTAVLAQRLASDGFTAVHYDRRGRGDSTDTLPYATEREVEDLDALVREVGGEAAVFAMSSGAALALEAAAAGVELTRLALYEPPLILPGTGETVPANYVERLDALIAEGRRADALGYFMVGAAGMTPDDFDEFRETPIFPAFEAIAHTLAYDGRLVEQATAGGRLPAERWSAVRRPVMVLDGGASAPFMRAAAQKVVDALPHAHRRTLDGQTHAYDVDVLAPVLAEWFAG
jgi:pimeloyl-ACP methyl ester carboxylesterase